jgi:hypothetical protein
MYAVSVRSLFVAACLSLLGCASAPPPPPPAAPPPAPAAPPPPPPQNAMQAELVGAPKWVLMGCAGYFGDKKDKVCGVGAIAGMTNPAMARTAAEGRGRTEIARSIKVKVKAMLSDYSGVTKGGPAGKLNNEEQLEDAAKQITNLTLSGTHLQDTWVSNTGTWYTLMVLDMDAFKASLKSNNQLDEQTRAAIAERADKAFAEIDRETEGTPAKAD